ncbi:Sigma-54 factor interaction domain-containing protein [Azospirillaceae bacterium]
MEDDYRQLSPFDAGIGLGNFSSSADEHINECIARIETLKLKILGNPHMGNYERTEFMAELNTLRAAYLYLCTLATKPVQTAPSDISDANAPQTIATNRSGLALEGILGNNPQISENLDRIARIAPSGLTVLLEGETGSGKELFARIIHLNSRRSVFVPVNCGALPSGVIESELFGHVKGAFTGATSDRKGRFEEANGGTIFLDEIGEMEPLAQVKLLRTLDVGEIQRVGSDRVQKIEVRVIAATNRNLESMVAKGTFREDLYFRLNICPFNIPPLRERRDEISLLLDFFIRKISAETNLPIPKIDHDILDFFINTYNFPGNIRELKNISQYIVHIYNGTPVRISDLPLRYKSAWKKSLGYEDKTSPQEEVKETAYRDVREKAEKEHLISSLTRNHGSIPSVCSDLKLSRARIYQLFKKYNIIPANYRAT